MSHLMLWQIYDISMSSTRREIRQRREEKSSGEGDDLPVASYDPPWYPLLDLPSWRDPLLMALVLDPCSSSALAVAVYLQEIERQ